MRIPSSIFLLLIIILNGCEGEKEEGNTDICPEENLLETFVSEGTEFYLYESGELFSRQIDECRYELDYFEPGFPSDTYIIVEGDPYFSENGNPIFPTTNNWIESFESSNRFVDLILTDVSQTDKVWTNFTLQSPETPTVEDYTSLANCILEENCTFLDNRIDLVSDPVDPNNTVLRFEAVPPKEGMVTSKASLVSILNYFELQDEVWFQADYFIESGMPYSIVDFENGHFYLSPGPRAVISANQVEFENKFGSKDYFQNDSNIEIELGTWFNIKIHLIYDNTENGVIEVWQDDVLIIEAQGKTLPTSNSIVNRLEIGATATSIGTVMYMDNVRISDSAW